MLLTLSMAALVCAAIPALLFCANLLEYREPPAPESELPAISVIVPARNEEAGISACITSVLASTHCKLEVIVLDDHSTDNTAALVRELSHGDARLRIVPSAPLPPDWNGKQHACWQGAQAATFETLCFLDADVLLFPLALARMSAFRRQTGATLVSGFPQQQTRTFLEKLLLPLMYFILLGLLPMRRMRHTTSPAYAAGCGQFLLCDRKSYFAVGGHSATRQTMHDGLMLPRLFRHHGLSTRLADLNSLASCRMYTNAAQVWNGLGKNATEGMAKRELLLPLTVFFGLGQIVPCVLFAVALVKHQRSGMICSGIALALAYLPRVIAVQRFHQSRLGALLHPFGIVTLLALQWNALVRKTLGRPATWKQRTYKTN
jgi:hypothetical protein